MARPKRMQRIPFRIIEDPNIGPRKKGVGTEDGRRKKKNTEEMENCKWKMEN